MLSSSSASVRVKLLTKELHWYLFVVQVDKLGERWTSQRRKHSFCFGYCFRAQHITRRLVMFRLGNVWISVFFTRLNNYLCCIYAEHLCCFIRYNFSIQFTTLVLTVLQPVLILHRVYLSLRSLCYRKAVWKGIVLVCRFAKKVRHTNTLESVHLGICKCFVSRPPTNNIATILLDHFICKSYANI